MKPFPLLCCAWLTIALAAGPFAVPGEASTITGVTINSASSAFSDRLPVDTINGSGLTGGLHNTNAGDMWLTAINLASNEPRIVYDLGAIYDLSSMHVWNYNENYGVYRAAKDVDVYVASSATSPVWTLVSSPTLTDVPHPYTANYAGAAYPLVTNNVRLVRLDIKSNYAGYTYPAVGQPDYNAVTGLSEIRFQARTNLWQDTFNNTLPNTSYTDYGLNQELASRQMGPDAPIDYVRVTSDVSRFQVNRADSFMPGPGKLTLFTNSSGPLATAVLNANFAHDVTLSVEVDPVVGNTSSSDWVAFGMCGQGTAVDNTDLTSATNAGVVFAIQSSGGWFVSQNGGQDYFASLANVTPNGDGSFDLSLTVRGDQFSAVVNGVLLDLNGAGPGTTMTLTGLAGGASNYISFGANYADGLGAQSGWNTARIDDLAVSVPEPANLALVGTGLLAWGLVCCLRRRRGKK